MQRWNVFAGPYLERAAHLRSDPATLEQAIADSRSRFVVLWKSRSLIQDGEASDGRTARAALLEFSQVAAKPPALEELILLGQHGGSWLFAYEIDALDTPTLPAGTRFEELRTIASLLPAKEAGLLGYAHAMVTWRGRHRFCGVCGAGTVGGKGGHVLICTNPDCRHEQFPRLDPAIIVLVSDGERALLGRQASWPAGRYSTIAGFVEPGESLEDAVAREVHEETGIEVAAIEYHSSQPWPFPSSLMLGFTARATSRDIQLNDRELEDARWFTRGDIKAGVPLLPPRQSISYRLIEHWFDEGGGPPLSEVLPTRG